MQSGKRSTQHAAQQWSINIFLLDTFQSNSMTHLTRAACGTAFCLYM